MPKLLYQGHGSYCLKGGSGFTIYVDPYAGEGYVEPADLILVTHQHGDHNNVEMCAKKPSCKIITNEKALANGKHNDFDIGGVRVQAVESSNANHSPKNCVGYIITLDGTKIYASGDTEHKRKAIAATTPSDNPLYSKLNSARYIVSDEEMLKRLIGLRD